MYSSPCALNYGNEIVSNHKRKKKKKKKAQYLLMQELYISRIPNIIMSSKEISARPITII